jgi:IS5 family transposase
MLGRVILDVVRKIQGTEALEGLFARPLALARRVKDQRQRERGRKVYALHAPEVECIGKGKAHKPYEFGVKVSVATPLHRCRGGQLVAHVRALPGNPYDGHTLATVMPDIEPSSREWSRMPATRATTHRKRSASGSTSPARSAGSRRH